LNALALISFDLTTTTLSLIYRVFLPISLLKVFSEILVSTQFKSACPLILTLLTKLLSSTSITNIVLLLSTTYLDILPLFITSIN